jgi:hypothetical protein
LFSLYVPDANSPSAGAVMRRLKPPLVATDLGEFEFVNVLNGRIFRKQLRAFEEEAVLVSFSKDVQAGLIRIIPISGAALAHATRLARTQTRLLGTRSLDVLHVASALALHAGSFCTFDKNRARLAAAVGLQLS